MVKFFRHILNHPCNRSNKTQAISRFLRWQIGSRILGKKVIHQFTEKSKLIVETGMTGATLNVYCGLQDFEDMGFFLHVLRPGDLFIDCGANVGSYSILASAHCGSDVLSIEALPDTYSKLQANFKINETSGEVMLKNLACGASHGKVHFTSDKDTMNHVSSKPSEHTVAVSMVTLDSLITDDTRNKFLKIDVEGFETQVLEGATDLLSSNELKCILIELNGSGERYGYSDSNIEQVLSNNGFSTYLYNPLNRIPSRVDTKTDKNVLFIKDVSFVKERIATANSFEVFEKRY